MRPARIAELLQPFLSASCHSEPAKAGESLPRATPSRQAKVSRGEPAVLSATQLQSISTYIDILQHWNARINLTAIRSEEEIVTRHFGESLFVASHLFPKVYPVSSSVSPVPALSEAEGSPVVKDVDVDVDVDVDLDVPEARSPKAEARVADIGSGAGFPGVPIKLWAPNIVLTLIESN